MNIPEVVTLRFSRKVVKRGILVMMLAAYLVLTADSCDNSNPTRGDQSDRDTTNRQSEIYAKAQPPHIYDYSMPRDVMIQIYDAIMHAHNTWSVFVDQGNVLDSCPSVGFPIPGGTQLTNPSRTVTTGSAGITTIPQAEPSGLFPPPIADATYVLCIRDGKVEPTYVESHVITYAHPVKVENGKIVHLSGPASITVNIRDTGSVITSPAPTATPSK